MDRRTRGISMVETLVSLSLVAVVLIPLLFVSSSFFLNNLTGMRSGVDVFHSATQLLNQMIFELQHTRRVLPGSSPTELRFVFHDEVTGNDYARGYRLVTAGSEQYLERLNYNESTETWQTAGSPYGAVAADAIHVPGSVVFRYCLDATCSGATALGSGYEKSVLVKLAGWVFSDTEGSGTFTLPSDINAYIGTGIQDGAVILGDSIREIYSFNLDSGFGFSTTATRVSPNFSGDNFYHIPVAAGGGGTPGLTTVFPADQNYLGYGSTTVDDTGRVTFNGWGNAYTWASGTGLSTIKTGLEGEDSTYVDPVSGRIFVMDDGAAAVTWTAAAGLSTIISGLSFDNPQAAVDPSDGRFYFGENAGANASRFFTWKFDTGLSTIVSGVTCPGCNDSGFWWNAATVAAVPGRVYFAAPASHQMFTWSQGTGLSTIVSASILGGVSYVASGGGMLVDNASARLIFGSNRADSPNYVFTWAPGQGLSTIFNSSPSAYNVTFSAPVFSGDQTYRYSHSSATESGKPRFFFLIGNSNIASWHPDTGLSYLWDMGNQAVQKGPIIAAQDGRVFFGSTDRMMTWQSSAGLSTIITGLSEPGNMAIDVDPSSSRVFFGENTSGARKMFTWHASTGVSTIFSGTNRTGGEWLDYNPTDGLIYFGNDGSSNANSGFYAWGPTTGLSTILMAKYPGKRSTYVNEAQGGVYFGHADFTGHFYYYNPGVSGSSATLSAGAVTSMGSLTHLTGGFDSDSTYSNYTVSAQDVDGEFYFVDGTANKLDRYTWDAVDSRYELTTQVSLGTWAGNVRAIAIDQADNGIALLVYDGASEKKIYHYNNRRSASPTLTTHNLATALATAPGKPTGLTVNGRTGDYLLIDATRNGGDPNYYSEVLVLSKADWGTAGAITTTETFKLKTKDSNFVSSDVSGETNFKIFYDDERNILYMLAPVSKRMFAMTLPKYLQ
ncbi:MAG: hypothetical protein AB7P76_10895 [Candidatus Melainabacteria bacterium]